MPRKWDGALTRVCNECDIEKSVADDFYIKRKETGSPYSKCKECMNRIRRERYAENPEKEREVNRAYWAANVEKMAEQKRRYYDANKEKRLAYNRRYYFENWEQSREIRRRYYHEHRDEIAAAITEDRLANPEKYREAGRRYRESNRAKCNDDAAAKRARKREAFVEFVSREIVYGRDEGICHLCYKLCDPDNFHVDHIVALANGGLHCYENVALAHPRCNIRKGAKELTSGCFADD